MRYEGKLEVIEDIETIIRNKSMAFEYVPKTRDNLFGVESVVKTVLLDVVSLNWFFPVRIFYDKRPGSFSVIDIRDTDLTAFIKIDPDIIKLLAKLSEQVNEKREGKPIVLPKEVTAEQ
jgi:hypothetical protein